MSQNSGKPPSPSWGGTAERSSAGWGAVPAELRNATDERQARAAAFQQARERRKQPTPHEARLWAWLKTLRAEGFQFRREAPFRGYFLDFVCFSRKLVVELDGSQHGEPDQAAHDAVRDRVLAREGFRTLRIWNADLNSNFDGVALMIRRALEAGGPPPCPAPPGCPSPQGRGTPNLHPFPPGEGQAREARQGGGPSE